MEYKEKKLIELMEQLLVELEHLQNTADILACGFIHERKDYEASSLYILKQHIKSVREEYDSMLSEAINQNQE